MPAVNEKAKPLTGVSEILSENFVINPDTPMITEPAIAYAMYFM